MLESYGGGKTRGKGTSGRWCGHSHGGSRSPPGRDDKVEEQLGGKIGRTEGGGACTISFRSAQQGDGGSVLQGGLIAKGQTDGAFAPSQRREEGGLPALTEEMERNHCCREA